MSYIEIFASNSIIILTLYFIERKWLLKTKDEKIVQYDVIENIKPKNYNLLKLDLEERTGLSICTIIIGDVDFLKDSATLTISYYINK